MENKDSGLKRSMFIAGEKIDLHAPVEEDFPDWASWFNNEQITRYMPQGLFPNSIENQKDFFRGALKSGRVLVMVKTKTGKLVGVTSLSGINHQNNSCQASIVCPVISKHAPLATLEAGALILEHAFEKFGMHRVWVSLAYPGHVKFTRNLELLGLKAEGIMRGQFKKGMMRMDTVILSLLVHEYLEIKGRRGGRLWPGEKNARAVLGELKKKEPLAEIFEKKIREIYVEHNDLLKKLEGSHPGAAGTSSE